MGGLLSSSEGANTEAEFREENTQSSDHDDAHMATYDVISEESELFEPKNSDGEGEDHRLADQEAGTVCTVHDPVVNNDKDGEICEIPPPSYEQITGSGEGWAESEIPSVEQVSIPCSLESPRKMLVTSGTQTEPLALEGGSQNGTSSVETVDSLSKLTGSMEMVDAGEILVDGQIDSESRSSCEPELDGSRSFCKPDLDDFMMLDSMACLPTFSDNEAPTAVSDVTASSFLDCVAIDESTHAEIKEIPDDVTMEFEKVDGEFHEGEGMTESTECELGNLFENQDKENHDGLEFEMVTNPILLSFHGDNLKTGVIGEGDCLEESTELERISADDCLEGATGLDINGTDDNLEGASGLDIIIGANDCLEGATGLNTIGADDCLEGATGLNTIGADDCLESVMDGLDIIGADDCIDGPTRSNIIEVKRSTELDGESCKVTEVPLVPEHVTFKCSKINEEKFPEGEQIREIEQYISRITEDCMKLEGAWRPCSKEPGCEKVRKVSSTEERELSVGEQQDEEMLLQKLFESTVEEVFEEVQEEAIEPHLLKQVKNSMNLEKFLTQCLIDESNWKSCDNMEVGEQMSTPTDSSKEESIIESSSGRMSDECSTIAASEVDGEELEKNTSGLDIGSLQSFDHEVHCFDQGVTRIEREVSRPDRDEQSADQEVSIPDQDVSSSDPDVKSLDWYVSSSDPDVSSSDRYVQRSNQDVSSSDRYVQSSNQYVPSSDRYVSSSDPDVSSSDPDVSSLDRYVQSSNQDVSSSDRYVQSSNQYVPSSDRYASSSDPDVSRSDRCGSSSDRYVSSSDQDVSSSDRYVQSSNQDVSSSDRYVSSSDPDVSSSDQDVSSSESYVSNSDQDVSSSESNVSNSDQDVSNTYTCVSDPDPDSPNQDQDMVTSPKQDAPSSELSMSTPNEDVSCPEEDVSSSDQNMPNQDQDEPNSEHNAPYSEDPAFVSKLNVVLESPVPSLTEAKYVAVEFKMINVSSDSESKDATVDVTDESALKTDEEETSKSLREVLFSDIEDVVEPFLHLARTSCEETPEECALITSEETAMTANAILEEEEQIGETLVVVQTAFEAEAANGGTLDSEENNDTGPGNVDADLTDAGFVDTDVIDAENVDADVTDAGNMDADVTDAENVDAGVTDAGNVDADVTDAGNVDADVTDAVNVDADVTDAGNVDADVNDARNENADVTDAGNVDASVADAGNVDGSDGASSRKSSIAELRDLDSKETFEEDNDVSTCSMDSVVTEQARLKQLGSKEMSIASTTETTVWQQHDFVQEERKFSSVGMSEPAGDMMVATEREYTTLTEPEPFEATLVLENSSGTFEEADDLDAKEKKNPQNQADEERDLEVLGPLTEKAEAIDLESKELRIAATTETTIWQKNEILAEEAEHVNNTEVNEPAKPSLVATEQEYVSLLEPELHETTLRTIEGNGAADEKMEETDELVAPGEEESRESLPVEHEGEDIECDVGNLGTVSVEQNAIEQNHEVVTEEICKYFDDGLDETPTNSTFCLEYQADELPIMSQVIIIESVNSPSRFGVAGLENLHSSQDSKIAEENEREEEKEDNGEEMERWNESGKNASPCTGSAEIETAIRVSPLPVAVTQLFVIVGNYEDKQAENESHVIAEKEDVEVSDIDPKVDVTQSESVVNELPQNLGEDEDDCTTVSSGADVFGSENAILYKAHVPIVVFTSESDGSNDPFPSTEDSSYALHQMDSIRHINVDTDEQEVLDKDDIVQEVETFPEKTEPSTLHKTDDGESNPNGDMMMSVESCITIASDYTVEMAVASTCIPTSIRDEDLSVTGEEETIKVEDAPDTFQDAPITNEDAPTKDEDTPIKAENVQITVEEAPNAFEDAPTTVEDASITVEISVKDSPNSFEDAPNTCRDASIKIEDEQKTVEDAPITVEEESIAAEDAQITAEDVPSTFEGAQNELKDALITVEDASITVEESPIAVEETPIAFEDNPRTIEDASMTVEDAPITVEDAPIPVEVAPVTAEDASNTFEDKPITVDDTPTAAEDAPITAVEDGLTTVEKAPNTAENALNKFEEAPITVDGATIKVEDAPIIAGDASIPVQDEPITVENAPITFENAPITVEDAPKTFEDAPITVEDAPATVEEGPITDEDAPITVVEDGLTTVKEAPNTTDEGALNSLNTFEETPIVNDDATITVEEAPVTVEDTLTTVEDASITNEDASITVENASITAVDGGLTTVEEAPDTSEDASITGEDAPIPVEDAPTTFEEASITVEDAPKTFEDAPIAAKNVPITDEKAPIPFGEAPIAVQDAPATVEDAPITVEDGSIAVEDASIPVGDAPIAVQNAPITSEDAPISVGDAPNTFEDAPNTFEDASNTVEDAPITFVEDGLTKVDESPNTAGALPITDEDALNTFEEAPITVDDATITLEEAPVAVEDALTTVEDASITVEDASITVEDASITVEDASIKAVEGGLTKFEEAPNTSEDASITDDDAPHKFEDALNAFEDTPITVDDAPITVEDAPITVEDALIAVQDAPITVEDALTTFEDAPISVDDAPNTLEDAPITVEEASITVDDAPTTFEDAPITAEKTPITFGEGSIAVQDAPATVEDAPITVGDASIAVEDEPIAIEDESITVGDKPIAAEVAPITIEHAPITFEDSPNTFEDAPITDEDKPFAAEDAPVTAEEASISIEDAPNTFEVDPNSFEDAPITVEDAPITENEAPVEQIESSDDVSTPSSSTDEYNEVSELVRKLTNETTDLSNLPTAKSSDDTQKTFESNSSDAVGTLSSDSLPTEQEDILEFVDTNPPISCKYEEKVEPYDASDAHTSKDMTVSPDSNVFTTAELTDSCPTAVVSRFESLDLNTIFEDPVDSVDSAESFELANEDCAEPEYANALFSSEYIDTVEAFDSCNVDDLAVVNEVEETPDLSTSSNAVMTSELFEDALETAHFNATVSNLEDNVATTINDEHEICGVNECTVHSSEDNIGTDHLGNMSEAPSVEKVDADVMVSGISTNVEPSEDLAFTRTCTVECEDSDSPEDSAAPVTFDDAVEVRHIASRDGNAETIEEGAAGSSGDDYAITTSNDAIPEIDDAILTTDKAIRITDDAISITDDEITTTHDAILPEINDATLTTDEAITAVDDAISEKDDKISLTDDAKTTTDSAISKTDNTILTSDDAILNTYDAILNTDNAISAIDDTLSTRTEVPHTEDDVSSAVGEANSDCADNTPPSTEMSESEERIDEGFKMTVDNDEPTLSVVSVVCRVEDLGAESDQSTETDESSIDDDDGDDDDRVVREADIDFTSGIEVTDCALAEPEQMDTSQLIESTVETSDWSDTPAVYSFDKSSSGERHLRCSDNVPDPDSMLCQENCSTANCEEILKRIRITEILPDIVLEMHSQIS